MKAPGQQGVEQSPPPGRKPSRVRRMLQSIPGRMRIWLAPAFLLLSGLALIPWPRAAGPGSYQLGMIQPAAVIAEFDFPILKDPGELERERAEQARRVPAVLTRVDTAAVASFTRLRRLEEEVQSLRLARGARRAGHDLPDRVDLSLTQETLIELLLGEKSHRLLQEAGSLLEDVTSRGYVSSELAAQISDYSEAEIHDPLGVTLIPSDQLLTAERVAQLSSERAKASGVDPAALAEVTLYCLVPGLRFDAADTEKNVLEARAGVDSATGLVLKGEKIIGAHERITAERLRVLRSYQYWRAQRGAPATVSWLFLPVLGRLLILILTVGAFWIYLRLSRPSLLRNAPDLWLLTVVEMLILLLSALFVRVLQLPPSLVPVAAVSILITLLFDERLAFAASAFPVLLISLVADAGTQFLAVIGVGAMATVLLTHAVRQRSQFFRHLALLPVVHLVMLGALALTVYPQVSGLLRDAAAVTANPFLAAALALAALPYAESLFGRSTDITLREYLDLNRPLLRRLMMQAPGTYHHSILVGTLAETAALAVGANPLLARVIGYYHDIGKVAKPGYFIENIVLGMKNPHDRLSPSMSRLIIESHVREGLALAREEKLPREVLQGIREHHGVSVMLQPWRRAKRQDANARLEDYCYPGPRPSRRCSALVLLADQVEGAARTLENPTPSRIKGLVYRVVQENLERGNLDEGGLTLRDLGRVRDAFVPILAAAFRGRVREDAGDQDAASDEAHPRHTSLPRGAH